MKIFLSVSATTSFDTHKIAGVTYLTLKDKAPKESKLAAIKKVPYARILLDKVWNSGTKSEKVIPTVDTLEVPDSLDEKVWAEPLAKGVLDWMAKNGQTYLIFETSVSDAFKTAAKKLPENITMLGKKKDRFGALHKKGEDVSKLI